MRWHHLNILFWVVIRSEKNWWLYLDVSISILWPSSGEFAHGVTANSLHIIMTDCTKPWYMFKKSQEITCYSNYRKTTNRSGYLCRILYFIFGRSFQPCIDEFQINEINVDLRTSGFDNEVLSVDACAVWWERESFYCLPHIGVVTWHREPRFQCGSARTGSIWNSSIVHLVLWPDISCSQRVNVPLIVSGVPTQDRIVVSPVFVIGWIAIHRTILSNMWWW